MRCLTFWVVVLTALALAGAQSSSAGQQRTQRQGQPESAMDDMLGKDVRNEQGQVLGQVVALSIRGGEIAYLLVSRDGNEEDLIVVPYAAARFDPRKNAVTLPDVDIARAPSLTPDDLQRLEDPEFRERVRGYYGELPADGRGPMGGPRGSTGPLPPTGKGTRMHINTPRTPAHSLTSPRLIAHTKVVLFPNQRSGRVLLTFL